jgi:hypothetical protein
MLQMAMLLMLLLHSGDVNTMLKSCHDGVSLHAG